jgi:hypothetical protein
MKHVLGSIIGVSKKPNPTAFQKSILTREWYMHPNGQIPAYE